MKKIIRLFLVVLMLSAVFVMPASVSAATKNGIKTEDGKKYYYKDGKKVKDKLGIKVGKEYYRIDAKGVAKKVSKVNGLAGIYAEKYKRDLYKAFVAISKMKYRNMPKMSNSEYACYGYETGYGDCKVQALSFYYVAKVLGYKDVKYVKGYVPQAVDKAGKPTKFGAHAWVTIKNKVYDPNLAATLANNKVNRKNAYAFKYGAKGTYQYYDKNKKKIK